jgi:hypothetical protein
MTDGQRRDRGGDHGNRRRDDDEPGPDVTDVPEF